MPGDVRLRPEPPKPAYPDPVRNDPRDTIPDYGPFVAVSTYWYVDMAAPSSAFLLLLPPFCVRCGACLFFFLIFGFGNIFVFFVFRLRWVFVFFVFRLD